MFEFLYNLFGREKSGNVAKERLQLVLIHDRNDIAPEVMNKMRDEMISVIKKYLEIDEQRIEISFDREDRSVALVANIPLVNMQRPTRGRKAANGVKQQRRN
jgi:cell division topological specificity factor